MGPKERSGGSVVKRVMRGNCSKERKVILSISKACFDFAFMAVSIEN